MKNEQEEVDKWIKQCGYGYFNPHEILARLVEETGELAREINHRFGAKKKKSSEKENEIGDEISDIIFTVICLANSLDIDLDESFEKMMDKYYTRDRDRFKKKD
jgi:NTP pyrophosphatase (non-canonical NTP hydrolase)